MPSAIADALSHVPPDLDRDTWARIAMAIKSELPGDDGFDIFERWSAGGSNYKLADVRATWRSVKASGGVGIGTLFALAREHGYRRPRGAAVQTAAAVQKATAERRERQAAEEEKYRKRADAAAQNARRLWDDASTEGQSPYLERKGVQAFGVRFKPDSTLLVPMRDAAGELQDLQLIAPRRPRDGSSDKRYLPGARKSGLWHWIGDPTAGAGVLLLAEGYATGASLHQASGHPVAVAFDAGNLRHVAKVVRSAWPAATIIVCSDDDRETETRSGKNPGRDAAASAARAAAEGGPAGVAVPAGLPDGGTDFNDLHAHAGLDAVRAIIAAAVKAPEIPKARRRAKSAAGDAIEGADVSAQGGGSGDGPGGPDDVDSRDDQTVPASRGTDPFELDDRGVWHRARDAEGNEKRPTWLCAPLRVAAMTRADDGNGWGLLLEFTDPDAHGKTWAMPSSLLGGEGAEWAGRLRDMGLQMAPGTRARTLVANYLDTRRPEERVTCTDRVGWHGPVYVLPSGAIAPVSAEPDARRYVFQSDAGMEDTFRRNGPLREWQNGVARLVAGNSRLVFAVCVALAGPALRPAGMESGGFHFRGDSSNGKTTALKVAASVWGRPTYMQRWRTTDNALESIAAQHCDCTLILDELGQLDPRVAGESAYLLANEQEKGRSTRHAQLRRRRTWRLLFLSSGEVSLAGHMAEAGKRTRAGMEVRMVDVPLDAGAGMGGLEQLHEYGRPAELADAIVSNAARHYGSAGRTWLEWLCEHFSELPDRLGKMVEEQRDALVPDAAAEQVRRVGSRFALVAAAGELATEAGITGWQAGEASRAVRSCFNAWLAARGHLDNGEDAAMVRQVRQFLELHGEARFTWWHRAADDHAPKTMNRAGFRRLLDGEGRPIKSDAEHFREYGDRMRPADGEQAQVEFIVLREVFRREVAVGFDPDAVATLLKTRGHLQGEGDRLMDRQRLPGVTGKTKAACYRIKPSLFEDDL
jgi:putative DNA primase/helicase